MPHPAGCLCSRCDRRRSRQRARSLPIDPMEAANKVLSLTNSYRRRRGLRTLRLSMALCRIARKHSEDMAYMRQMSHEGSDGSHHAERMKAMGYHRKYGGENIAKGVYIAEELFEGWRNSPTHHYNLVCKDYKDMGLSLAYGKGKSRGIYWTQLFGQRK